MVIFNSTHRVFNKKKKIKKKIPYLSTTTIKTPTDQTSLRVAPVKIKNAFCILDQRFTYKKNINTPSQVSSSKLK